MFGGKGSRCGVQHSKTNHQNHSIPGLKGITYKKTPSLSASNPHVAQRVNVYGGGTVGTCPCLTPTRRAVQASKHACGGGRIGRQGQDGRRKTEEEKKLVMGGSSGRQTRWGDSPYWGASMVQGASL
jgi:hypothetical protein